MNVTLRTGVMQAPTEYGIALLDEDTGEYWNLNPTAATVLRALLDGGTPEDAARALCAENEIDMDAAARDVHELLDELRSARLVEPQELP